MTPDPKISSFLKSYPEVPSHLVDKICTYYKILVEWNPKINLTRNDRGERFFIENVLDPILSAKVYEGYRKKEGLKPAKTLIDLGCGGGFVGIFWTLLQPELDCAILFDANRKKINFCKQVIRELGLKNIEAIQGRAEKFLIKGTVEEGFDVVVSRATWSFSDFVKIAKKYLAPFGEIVSFQGPSFQTDDPHFKILTYNIPFLEQPRRIVIGKEKDISNDSMRYKYE